MSKKSEDDIKSTGLPADLFRHGMTPVQFKQAEEKYKLYVGLLCLPLQEHVRSGTLPMFNTAGIVPPQPVHPVAPASIDVQKPDALQYAENRQYERNVKLFEAEIVLYQTLKSEWSAKKARDEKKKEEYEYHSSVFCKHLVDACTRKLQDEIKPELKLTTDYVTLIKEIKLKTTHQALQQHFNEVFVTHFKTLASTRSNKEEKIGSYQMRFETHLKTLLDAYPADIKLTDRAQAALFMDGIDKDAFKGNIDHLRKTYSTNPSSADDPYPATIADASTLVERWYQDNERSKKQEKKPDPSASTVNAVVPGTPAASDKKKKKNKKQKSDKKANSSADVDKSNAKTGKDVKLTACGFCMQFAFGEHKFGDCWTKSLPQEQRKEFFHAVAAKGKDRALADFPAVAELIKDSA